MPRVITYKVIIRPSVEYLSRCGKLLLDTKSMAEFLSLKPSEVQNLLYTDRLPAPVRLGILETQRWNVFELLDWVAAGCPRRGAWIDMHGWSGWVRRR